MRIKITRRLELAQAVTQVTVEVDGAHTPSVVVDSAKDVFRYAWDGAWTEERKAAKVGKMAPLPVRAE